jgi:putative ABC transport system substrate-binding protein
MLDARRREFITLLGSAATAWPIGARAQQGGRVRLIGWLDGRDESIELRSPRTALREALARLGWIEGDNLKIEQHVGVVDPNRLQAAAAELVSGVPEVIIAGGAAATRALQQATQTVPIVFTGGGDAAATGLVKNMARPEGNTTGFSSTEPTIGGKWLELLKEAAPRVVRVAVVVKPEVAPASPYYIASIETAARTLSVQTVKAPFRDAVELVRSIDAFAAEPNSGLLMLPPPYVPDRLTILKLAVQHRLLRSIPNGLSPPRAA